MSENLMKAAVLGGLAGVSGVANVVDEMYLKKSLGFKRDSAQSAFVRGAVIGAAGLAVIGFLRTQTTALDMFGLGAPMHTKDRKDENPDSHKARMPHVSKKSGPQRLHLGRKRRQPVSCYRPEVCAVMGG